MVNLRVARLNFILISHRGLQRGARLQCSRPFAGRLRLVDNVRALGNDSRMVFELRHTAAPNNGAPLASVRVGHHAYDELPKGGTLERALEVPDVIADEFIDAVAYSRPRSNHREAIRPANVPPHDRGPILLRADPLCRAAR